MDLKIGTDIVSVARIEKTYARFGARFLEKILTESERQYVLSRGKRLIESLAARFAAKEACSKVLGTGWSQLDWKEVEVTRRVTGEPGILLHGRAQALAERRHLTRFELSISHEREFAIAFIVAYGE